MLDSTTQNLPLLRRRKRAYGRIINGVKFAFYHHQDLYFLTLTSSSRKHDLVRDFSVLVKRIRRKYGLFEYIYVRTDEGFGVLHILFKSRLRLDIDWLRSNWVKLHDAPQMNIQKTYGSAKDVTKYLAGYLSHNAIVRTSSSSLWIFRGWIAHFCAHIRLNGFYEGIRTFDLFMKKFSTQSLYTQKYSRQTVLECVESHRHRSESLSKHNSTI